MPCLPASPRGSAPQQARTGDAAPLAAAQPARALCRISNLRVCAVAELQNFQCFLHPAQLLGAGQRARQAQQGCCGQRFARRVQRWQHVLRGGEGSGGME